MQVVKEILDAERAAGHPLYGIEEVKDSNESLVDKAKYLLIWYQEELNLGNTGNRMSLLNRLTEIYVVIRDADRDYSTIKAETISFAEAVRGILKRNPRLISTSAPTGFATTSEIGEISDAEPADDEIPSHSVVVPFRAWYFKNEAAA